MTLDTLELQLASALQRYNTLQRRAEAHREPGSLLTKTLAELGSALEQLRQAQEQLHESRARIEQLQVELREQSQRYWQLFDDMPDAYAVTRQDSIIVEANKAAAQLLNVSQRFLIGKALSVFVCEDRARFFNACGRASATATPFELSLKLRPRERAPLVLTAHVCGDATGLRWVLRPAPKSPEDAAL